MTVPKVLVALALVGLALVARSAAPVVATLDSLDAGVVLTGHWFAPPQSDKPQAAVLALHGCGGLLDDKGRLGPSRERYVQLLHDAGIGVLFIDSFVPRGQRSICSQKPEQRTITEAHRRLDVYAGLAWLARQPGVDGQRLGVIGWSHGGQTVLSSADVSQAMVLRAAVKPAALVAFYPGCSGIARVASFQPVAPLLVMSGALDDWTPAEPCRRWTQRIAGTAGGKPVEYIEYAGSYHGFDSTLPPRERGDVGGTRSGKATVGGNPVAREESATAMLRFLQNHLQR